MTENTLHTEFEQRRALQKFHEIVTQDYIENTANQLSFKDTECNERLANISNLSSVFDNSTGVQNEALEYMMGRAIRYRDAYFVNLCADVMFDFKHQKSPEFQELAKKYLGTPKPALRPVR